MSNNDYAVDYISGMPKILKTGLVDFTVKHKGALSEFQKQRKCLPFKYFVSKYLNAKAILFIIYTQN